MVSLFEIISDNPILTGLFLMAISALSPKVRDLMHSFYRWIIGQLSAWATALGSATLQELRRQMLERAKNLGITIPVSRRGHRPEEWKYSNGLTLYYYAGDLEAYKTDMKRGVIPRRRAHHGDPPNQLVLDETSRRQIRDWLREHPMK